MEMFNDNYTRGGHTLHGYSIAIHYYTLFHVHVETSGHMHILSTLSRRGAWGGRPTWPDTRRCRRSCRRRGRRQASAATTRPPPPPAAALPADWPSFLGLCTTSRGETSVVLFFRRVPAAPLRAAP